MSKEVSINMNVFRSNVSKLRSAVAEIETNKTTNSFSKTNIEPFTKDLENVIEAMELLEQYKTILESDIVTLEQTGEQMKEQDEKLASVNYPISGPQPIR
ncbi:TIGR04197 family type VII secretion effector [Gracilibacillus sp. D59]|uniref:TIGR04197 family type VII secretion effector n=1 Tax=Gracilibacillus sp. D59 TaxID=3457434 RepID=UPI003FCDF3BC